MLLRYESCESRAGRTTTGGRTESGWWSLVTVTVFSVLITSVGTWRWDFPPCRKSTCAMCLDSLCSERGEARLTGDIGIEITPLVEPFARSQCRLLAFNVARREFNMTGNKLISVVRR